MCAYVCVVRVCMHSCKGVRGRVRACGQNPRLPNHTYYYLTAYSQCSIMGLVNVIDVKGEIDDRSAITFAAELYAQLASLGASAMQQSFMVAKRVLRPEIAIRYRCLAFPPGESLAPQAQMRLHNYEMNALSHYDFDAHNRAQRIENLKVHTLRPYQKELLDVAKQQNSVVCLRNPNHSPLPATIYPPTIASPLSPAFATLSLVP